jgi:hypothetical protein
MVLGRLNGYMQRNEAGFLPDTTIKRYSKWTKDLNGRDKI